MIRMPRHFTSTSPIPPRSSSSTRGEPIASRARFPSRPTALTGWTSISAPIVSSAPANGTLVSTRVGQILAQDPLSGAPDVVFFDRVHRRLYVAVGDPGTIDVFETSALEKLGSVATEKGAHTFALAPRGEHLYAFLPASHRAANAQAADSGAGQAHEKN